MLEPHLLKPRRLPRSPARIVMWTVIATFAAVALFVVASVVIQLGVDGY